MRCHHAESAFTHKDVPLHESCGHAEELRWVCSELCGRSSSRIRSTVILFLFVNKRRDRMKAIFWDNDGFVIWYKRLEVGTWQLPGSTSTTLELEAHELAMILRGIDLKSARRRARYQQPVAV